MQWHASIGGSVQQKGRPAENVQRRTTLRHVAGLNQCMKSKITDRENVFVGTVQTGPDGAWITNIRVRNVSVCFKNDTGAGVTVISENVFKKHKIRKSYRKQTTNCLGLLISS